MSAIFNMPAIFALALRALCVLAAHQGRIFKARDIADSIGCSLPNLTRTLQLLKKKEIVVTRKGPGGGYLLQRPPEEISLLEIHEAVEGPLRSPGCDIDACHLTQCRMEHFLEYVTELFREKLGSRTLADFLACDFSEGEDSSPYRA